MPSNKSRKEQDWPEEALAFYEKIDILGKGSFGFVWMAKRKPPAEGKFDDEYVAIKNIAIKDDKGKLYAQREISILRELNHPNIIKFIREFSSQEAETGSRLIAIQLVRGGDLHNIVKLGALGLPLSRLVSRQLVGAVSYMHGRAVIHRDIKPGNCILENTTLGPHDQYDWMHDNQIWDSTDEAEKMVNSGKWKLMLIDFGFARALQDHEIRDPNQKRMRNSIMNENKGPQGMAGAPPGSLAATAALAALEEGDDEDATNVSDEDGEEDAQEDKKTNDGDSTVDGTVNAALGEVQGRLRRQSLRVEDIDEAKYPNLVDMSSDDQPVQTLRRSSQAQRKIRSMSALGTRAYAAPEIKKKLRRKTKEDTDKTNAALTECVADYGMTVDAYSVGWTLRVLLTGVPPNITISDFLQKIEDEDSSLDDFESGICCCFSDATVADGRSLRSRVRDTTELPDEATLLIDAMTKTDPEERMTVREAQNHPYIHGNPGEAIYRAPQGDFPSMTGDPVVPLKCAEELSKLVELYHDKTEKESNGKEENSTNETSKD